MGLISAYGGASRRLGALSSFGLLVLRLGLGACFCLIYGLPKMRGGPELWEKLGHSTAHVGITFLPAFWGFMAAFAECAGGVLLILGLFSRGAAFLMMCTMIVAVATLHASGQGWQPVSQPLILACVFAGLVFVGPGRYSLDAAIGAA